MSSPLDEAKRRLEEVKSTLATIRSVKAGDYVTARFHNTLVDLVRGLSDALDSLATAVSEVYPPPELPSKVLKDYGWFTDASITSPQTKVTLLSARREVDVEIEGQPASGQPFQTLRSPLVCKDAWVSALKDADKHVFKEPYTQAQEAVYTDTVWVWKTVEVTKVVKKMKTMILAPEERTLQLMAVEGPVLSATSYVSAYDPTYKLVVEPLHDTLNVVVDCGIKKETLKGYMLTQDLEAVEGVKRSLDAAITAVTTKQPTTLLGPAKACVEEVVNVGGTVEEEVKETVKVVIW